MPSALLETLLLNTSHASLHRSKIPAFLYGCAWKKSSTTELVFQALSKGFTGIDVAAQPRHYREDLAGIGIRKAIHDQNVKREDLFIQTKYTPTGGQDLTNLPYDPDAPVAEQVRTSIASSLKNLRHSENPEEPPYIDCLVLHSPLPTLEQTVEAWQTCEEYVPSQIRNLGISNVTLPILKALYDFATIKPTVVQNRFHRDTLYEVPLRAYCREKGIVFQSFWTLTANPNLLRCRPTVMLANSASVEHAVALYCLVLGLENTIILNGTQNHVESDLKSVQSVRNWVVRHMDEWEDILNNFKIIIGEGRFDAGVT